VLVGVAFRTSPLEVAIKSSSDAVFLLEENFTGAIDDVAFGTACKTRIRLVFTESHTETKAAEAFLEVALDGSGLVDRARGMKVAAVGALPLSVAHVRVSPQH